MHEALLDLYYPFVTTKLQLLLYGAGTTHEPSFVAARAAPRQDWIVMCFHTPFLIRTPDGLELGQPGDCVVHDASYSEWHTTAPDSTEGFRNDWLHIATPGMTERVRRYGIPLNRRIPTGFGLYLADHLRVIENEDRRREAFWQERIGIELEAVLLRIGRAEQTRQASETLSQSERHHLAQFTEIRSAMLDHFQRSWTVSALAAQARLSPNRFSVLYALFFNISPIDELIQHRLKQSCTMLVSSAATLEAIAEACGFTDAAYFSRVFKRRIGCSPGAYRKLGIPQVAT